MLLCMFFFQAEDGIRDLVRSRGLGDVYKRQGKDVNGPAMMAIPRMQRVGMFDGTAERVDAIQQTSLIHI